MTSRDDILESNIQEYYSKAKEFTEWAAGALERRDWDSARKNITKAEGYCDDAVAYEKELQRRRNADREFAVLSKSSRLESARKDLDEAVLVLAEQWKVVYTGAYLARTNDEVESANWVAKFSNAVELIKAEPCSHARKVFGTGAWQCLDCGVAQQSEPCIRCSVPTRHTESAMIVDGIRGRRPAVAVCSQKCADELTEIRGQL